MENDPWAAGVVVFNEMIQVTVFPHKLGDVCNQIYHPFIAGPLLANPRQEINVTDGWFQTKDTRFSSIDQMQM